MLIRIKETKADLLSLNEKQLQNTTKLTILQNHQLTTELEYQSKQTEKLLYMNNKMQEQIAALRKDIEIHKQVENELAKRSHFCQKVIKKLNDRIRELNDDVADARKGGKAKKKRPKAVDHEKTNEDLINFLEQKLEEIEKKQSTTQNEYDILKGDYSGLLDKFILSREKYKRAALLLTVYLDDLLNTTPNLLSHEQDMHLNLDKMYVAPSLPRHRRLSLPA